MIKMRFQTNQKNLSQLCRVHYETPTELDRKPVEELCDGDKTDAKAKSADSAKV